MSASDEDEDDLPRPQSRPPRRRRRADDEGDPSDRPSRDQRQQKPVPLSGVVVGVTAASLLVLFSCCIGFSGCNSSKKDSNPSNQEVAKNNKDSKGTLILDLADNQIQGAEFFIDGGLRQPSHTGDRTITFPELQTREYQITIRVKGEEVFANKVTVKPQQEGATHVRVPKWDEGGEGTLVLDIPNLSGNRMNTELFVNGQVDARWANLLSHFGPIREFRLVLKPGPHTIVLKKNSVEVYKKVVEVKKPSAGTTFESIDLITTGTIRLTSKIGVRPGEEVAVYLDSQRVKEWPVGALSVEIPAEVGMQRVLEVRSTKPREAVLFRKTFPVDPGQEYTFSVD